MFGDIASNPAAASRCAPTLIGAAVFAVGVAPPEGALWLGSHAVKAWSPTQATVTLPCRKAEFYGVVKTAGLGLGQRPRFKDLGLDIPPRVRTDSVAAMGVSSRYGIGHHRHSDTHDLWVRWKP